MDKNKKTESRRKFIAWGVASAAMLTAIKYLLPNKPKPVAQTVKMLTEEGKLVEVDIKALSENKKKITDTELQNWIKK